MLGLLGDSSTDSGSGDFSENGRPELQFGRLDLIFPCPLYFFLFLLFSACLLPLFHCLISCLLYPHMCVFRRTRVRDRVKRSL